MKKIIPFKHEIKFDSNLYEVTSISLENTLHKDGNLVEGNFIVSGEYRVTETSINTLTFSYDIPFMIDIDDIYDISESSIDINDFYYEIVNNKILVVNIEVKLDHIKELLLERKNKMEDVINDVPILEDDVEENKDVVNNIDIDDSTVVINNIEELKEDRKSLFFNIDSTDNYVNYKIYIVRENDNVDTIMNKYNVTKEMLEEYNDISNMKIGDKIIIPYVKN